MSKDLIFSSITGANDIHYKVTLADVGCDLKCEAEPRDKTGRTGQKVESVTTRPIDPALPKVLSLKILGPTFHTTKYEFTHQYYGGKEGKSSFLWFKANISKGKEENYVPIKGQST